ncbi:MAG TPA: uroporphyrinogen-III synthase [Methylocella sp.]|nr:uroporphyrinogen-III synthase [Methylocella sp.]
MGALDGLNILVPESRELDLFAQSLEAEGAVAIRCPLIDILDLDDPSGCEAWIAELISGSFQDVVWLTGEGLRRLLAIAERKGFRAPFVEALGRVRLITRGPKPVRALRELGLASNLMAPAPTSESVFEALAKQDIKDRSIGVQLYPVEGEIPLLRRLREKGARVYPVTPYRYSSKTETDQVADAIRTLAAGQIDVIAFTSSPQVERLFDVARESGLDGELRGALARVRIAAVGPVVEEALRSRGVTQILRPDSGFHLKPLVRAIAAGWDPIRRRWDSNADQS